MQILVTSSGGAAMARRVPSRFELFIGDRLTRQRLRFTAAATIIVGSLLLIVSFATTQDNRTANGLNLGSDWMAFYNAGTILNQYDGSRLYDLDLQAALYHAALPDEPAGVQLPYANAPFLAVTLRPLAMMPYQWSYAVWIAISMLLYAGGLMLVWPADGPLAPYRAVALLVAFSFEPFVIECLHGGQISVIGFFAICCAIRFSRGGSPLLAGCCLAICTYKPTLLPLVLPMLVVMRQWRTLAGFALGAALLGAVSLLMAGPQACGDYVRLLCGYASRSSSGGSSGLQLVKFIDLNSFLKLLGVPSPVILGTLLGTGVLLGAAVWRVRPRGDAEVMKHLPLAWGAAITWTIVLNLYVGVYDAILIIPAIVLLSDALLRRATDTPRNLPLRLRCLLVGVWVLPWVSGIAARGIEFQPFTVAVLILAIYQLQVLRRRTMTRRDALRIAENDRRQRPIEGAQAADSTAGAPVMA